MSTIANVSSAGIPGYILPATNAGGSPVAKTADSGLAQTAVDLSSAGSIVATLGGGSSSPLTYDAAGLLNALAQAGAAPAPVQTTGGSSNSQATQNSANQAIVSTLPANSVAAGTYSSSGSLQGLPSNTTANWASALKVNPSLASSVISDSFNQGIVGTLSTTA